MFESIWAIKLKFRAILNEIKWSFVVRRQDIKSIKEFSSILLYLFLVHIILVVSDIIRFFKFIKSMILKKIILIPLSVMIILFTLYLSFINGSPNHKLFVDKFFPKWYSDIAIELYDPQNRFVGTVAQPKSSITNPSMFIDKIPPMFWSLLQEKYDPYLDFDNNATMFYQSLLNGGYYNGIDTSAPLIESKKLILHLIKEQNFNVKINLTLTQQLINAFLKKHPFQKYTNNIERLKLAKTFFHQLKLNNGFNFKEWLLTEKDFFIINGKGYGLKDCIEIFFGKSIEDLSIAQEAILVALYEKPYQMDISLKRQKELWNNIKKDAIDIINNSKIIKNYYKVVSDIKKMPFPKLPYLPDSLMEIVGDITSKNQEQFSTLPTRSDFLLQSIKIALRDNLDSLFQEYSISPKSKLVTKVKLNFDINDNFYFNHYFKAQIEALNLKNIWISVANQKGQIIRLYQQNSKTIEPQPIGNISKIFSTLLFVDRGDKYYTQYCNKNSKDKLPLENGYKRCVSQAWIDARVVFASDKMLPNYDAFVKYKEQNRQGVHIYYKPIYRNKIDALYQNLYINPLEKGEPIVRLGTGKLKMTPLELHKSLHKITQLIYNPNHIFDSLRLIKSFQYHTIQDGVVQKETKTHLLDSPEQISPTFQNFFTKNKRVILKTIFKTPIYKSYGSLQWLKNYIGVKFIFAKDSHQNGLHWLVGVFKKSNKYYTFTIYIKDTNHNDYKVKKYIQKLLEITIQSITKSKKMKFEYMKQVFRD